MRELEGSKMSDEQKKECNNTAQFFQNNLRGVKQDALIGAKETIEGCKTKLAIRTYHSNEDIIRIADWIYQLAPKYKLYVRHHDFSAEKQFFMRNCN